MGPALGSLARGPPRFLGLLRRGWLFSVAMILSSAGWFGYQVEGLYARACMTNWGCHFEGTGRPVRGGAVPEAGAAGVFALEGAGALAGGVGPDPPRQPRPGGPLPAPPREFHLRAPVVLGGARLGGAAGRDGRGPGSARAGRGSFQCAAFFDALSRSNGFAAASGRCRGGLSVPAAPRWEGGRASEAAGWRKRETARSGRDVPDSGEHAGLAARGLKTWMRAVRAAPGGADI